MLPTVPTLTLSILPFPYTPSPPPNIFHDLSSFLCLKWTMYIAFICNSHSFIVGGSKLHSKLWFFYLYYLVLCSWTKIKNIRFSNLITFLYRFLTTTSHFEEKLQLKKKLFLNRKISWILDKRLRLLNIILCLWLY